MFGTLVTDFFFSQLHGTLFSVACTVLLYTWHGAFRNQERTAVFHFLYIRYYRFPAFMPHDQ